MCVLLCIGVSGKGEENKIMTTGVDGDYREKKRSIKLKKIRSMEMSFTIFCLVHDHLG